MELLLDGCLERGYSRTTCPHWLLFPDNSKELPIILLSARAGEESSVEGHVAGADDYLIKPFSARELLARVSAKLEMSRVRQEAVRRVEAERAFLEAVLQQMPVGVIIAEAPSGKISLFCHSPKTFTISEF